MTPRRILMLAAILKYGFRPPGVIEDEAAYLAQLIDHVDARDHSAAHELRVGRPQAEWTEADVEAFKESLSHHQMPPDTFAPGLHALAVLCDPGPYPVTDEKLLELMGRGVEFLCNVRRKEPRADLPIIASVLLYDGQLLSAPVGRGDRVAVLKMLAQTQPVFGYFIVFDAFVHGIDTVAHKATKRDVIMAHAGHAGAPRYPHPPLYGRGLGRPLRRGGAA